MARYQAVWGVQHALHFLLMLMAMTFEVGVFMSVIGGLALGHAMFARHPSEVADFHRHAH